MTKRAVYLAETASDGSYRGMFRPREIADLLVQEGWRVTIVATSTSNQWPGRLATGTIRCGRSSFVRLPVPFASSRGFKRAANMAAFAAQCIALLWHRRFRREEVVVLTASTGFLDCFAARLAQRLLGFRWMLEIRDVWPDAPRQLNPGLTTFGFLRLSAAGVSLGYRHADALLTPLDQGYRLPLERARGRSIPTLYLPNCSRRAVPSGIPHVDQGEASEAAQMLTLLQSRFSTTVGYFGSINRFNGTLKFLELAALPTMRDVGFFLVGDGEDLQECKRLAQGMDNVALAPPAPPQECRRLSTLTTILMLGISWYPAARYGISPIKYTDYLSAGRPIFSWGASLGDSENGHGHMVHVPHDASAADAARQLRRLIDRSAAEHEQMGILAQGRLLSQYQYPAHRKRIAEFFAGVLAGQPLQEDDSVARRGGSGTVLRDSIMRDLPD